MGLICFSETSVETLSALRDNSQRRISEISGAKIVTVEGHRKLSGLGAPFSARNKSATESYQALEHLFQRGTNQPQKAIRSWSTSLQQGTNQPQKAIRPWSTSLQQGTNQPQKAIRPWSTSLQQRTNQPQKAIRPYSANFQGRTNLPVLQMLNS